MNQKIKDELKKLAGDDPEVQAIIDGLEKNVDSINDEITAKNLIRRDKKSVEPIPPVVPPAVPPPPPPPGNPPTVVVKVQGTASDLTSQELEMDEATMESLAERVAQKLVNNQDAHYTTLETAIAEMNTAVEQSIKDANATLAKLEERVKALEAPLSEQVQTALEDMPRATAKIIYRPRERQAEQPEPEEESTEDIAQVTLANLKAKGE